LQIATPYEQQASNNNNNKNKIINMQKENVSLQLVLRRKKRVGEKRRKIYMHSRCSIDKNEINL